MFSGIIEKKAQILSRDGGRFTIKNHFWNDLQIGQSIAHDGACMTIESFDTDTYTFFAMEESLNLTNFWEKNTWDSFNVERCLKVWDRIDGHFVSGHIDSIGKIKNLTKNPDGALIVDISYDISYSDLVVHKWSITLNGTSLTVTHNTPGELQVWLIPITQEMTNLWKLQIWDTINIEFDMLWKYIKNLTLKN